MIGTNNALIYGNVFCQYIIGNVFTFFIDKIKDIMTPEVEVTIIRANIVNIVSQVPALSRNFIHKNKGQC